ncbi:Hypothetical protein PBC10988_31030 [Planctomycetales bacterium 10988]|nr:Hypothetical protein PBC10988_31030 [Planctomycetales bacterium 10988]
MPNQLADIQQSLRALQSQIAESPDLPEQLRYQLADTLAELEKILPQAAASQATVESDSSSSSASEDSPEPQAATLQDMILQFEESHPTLSRSLVRLLDILGQLGI